VVNFLDNLRDSGKFALVIDPSIKMVYSLIALIEKQRSLLAVLEAQGQIHIDDLSLELGVPPGILKRWIYDLVRRDLFSGYVDWDSGIVSSLEAATLAELDSCPNCGGNVELAGKGVIRCEYCGVEIFLPRGRIFVQKEQSTPEKRLIDISGDTETPSPGMGSEPEHPYLPETRFRRFKELIKPNLTARRMAYAALGLLVLGFLCSISMYWMVEPPDSVEMPLFGFGLMVLPLVALVLVISGFVEKRNPPRFLLWSSAVVVISLSGAILTGLMFVDPDAGAELSLYTILVSVAPFTLVASLPAVYYGVKSWPEVATVLQLQLDERALDLIQTRGEIKFSELAQLLEIPMDRVDNLVDKLLRSKRLSGTMSLSNQRVYTEEILKVKRKDLMSFVQEKGQVQLDEIIHYLDAPLDLVRDWIYQLFQLNQFKGYINWSEGMLYSVAAEKMGSASQCPHCGGDLSLVAENVIQCQHCGSEIFASE
jgi:DNA-directed RNA polymerase subunit RPC12/RpoP